MQWQDVVLATANIVFAASLCPMLVYHVKPPMWTSVPTGLALVVCSLTVWTLDLWWTGTMMMVMGMAWMVLAWQRVIQRRGWY